MRLLLLISLCLIASYAAPNVEHIKLVEQPPSPCDEPSSAPCNSSECPCKKPEETHLVPQYKVPPPPAPVVVPPPDPKNFAPVKVCTPESKDPACVGLPTLSTEARNPYTIYPEDDHADFQSPELAPPPPSLTGIYPTPTGTGEYEVAAIKPDQPSATAPSLELSKEQILQISLSMNTPEQASQIVPPTATGLAQPAAAPSATAPLSAEQQREKAMQEVIDQKKEELNEAKESLRQLVSPTATAISREEGIASASAQGESEVEQLEQLEQQASEQLEQDPHHPLLRKIRDLIDSHLAGREQQRQGTGEQQSLEEMMEQLGTAEQESTQEVTGQQALLDQAELDVFAAGDKEQQEQAKEKLEQLEQQVGEEDVPYQGDLIPDEYEGVEETEYASPEYASPEYASPEYAVEQETGYEGEQDADYEGEYASPEYAEQQEYEDEEVAPDDRFLVHKQHVVNVPDPLTY